jgi:hypothetical protein
LDLTELSATPGLYGTVTEYFVPLGVRYKRIYEQGPPMKTLQEIERAIETLPWRDRLRLYQDMPQLIGGDVESLDWQRWALDRFFQDDSPYDHVYDHV